MSGRCENEGPGDGLPGAEFAGQQAAFGVADGRGHDGAEEQQIGQLQLSDAAGLRRGETNCRNRADAGDQPECHGRPFVAAEDRHRCGRRGE